MGEANNNYKRPITTVLFLTFHLSSSPNPESARRISGEGVEGCSHKTSIKQAEYFAARPADSGFGSSGMLGWPSFWLLLLGRARKSN
jgi:hypothetical protein